MKQAKGGREKLAKVTRSRWFAVSASLLLGALIILGVRFATYHHNDVHYHANFALYINGSREQFKSPSYYQEVSMCEATPVIKPVTRAHMHDNANDVVHVEDHAVTWGHFFTNIGWYIGPNFIQSPDGTMYLANGASKLNLVLNGQDYTDLGGIANYVINDKDKLLVSFGDIQDGQLKQEFAAIPSTATKYDTQKDPATCSGHGKPAIRERLHHLF